MRRGLTIIVSGTDPQRLASALRLAAAEAALGAPVRLFFDAGAAPCFAAPSSEAVALIETALDLGVAISVCQTGLADHRIAIDHLDPRIEPSGLVASLAAAGDDRLLMA